ncbi:MAG: lysylphosphatidylglycerol synthase transmembrane domain-containing protein [Thiohalomonadales bacterium]
MYFTKKHLLFGLKLSAGSGLLLLLFYQVDFDSFLQILAQVKLKYFLLSIFISIISLLAKAYKWHLLLEIQGGNISVRRAVNLTFISIFFNNFFLGTLGGDGFRALKTLNSTDKKAGAVTAIIMDRITGVIALVSVVIVSAGGGLLLGTALSKVPMMNQVFQLSLLSLLVGVSILIGFVKIKDRIVLRRPGKVLKFMMDVLQALGKHRLTEKNVVIAYFLSVIYHLLTVLAMYAFVLAVGISINGFDLLVIVPIVAFLLMVPISVNGIGVQEGAFFFSFVLIGVTSDQALVLSILPRIGVIVISLFGAFLFMLERKTT